MVEQITQDPEITFFTDKKMPCCGKEIKFHEGPHGGLSTNIKCAHCGQKWNICPEIHFIEKI